MPLFRRKNVWELELLSGYLDGCLNAFDKSKAKRLLAASPAARALLSELRATTQVLWQAPHATPRRSFAVRADILTAPTVKPPLLRARLRAPVASAATASRQQASTSATSAPQPPPAGRTLGSPRGADTKAGADVAIAVATPNSQAAIPTTMATPTATPAPEPTAFATAPLELLTLARHFPWLPIEIAAGLLTVVALGFTFWVYRVRARF